MPKMKTKSGIKKRVKMNGAGAIIFRASNTRHLLRNKSKSQKRKMGMEVMNESDKGIVMKWLPYALKKGV